ncbi:YobI family P-loop NTPase [Vibrio parahaemolyticus]|uniref:YobI family P-loop NTPase n=3 Tax=Vibrio parahaemolyticus TaxID=670 RepID=UPI001122DA2F|nr:ATP-binding protein [Vibrio parahaemolyticus]MBM5020774.1 ATP-binding protein [Vibrio parahaemolyticus]MDF4587333.1 ATP-binding protein [Vibrio parahaemolyticus]MDF4713674.1 ATP-binding protein [Vibrio parahaemolyticus]TOH92543.1 DNA-binding protein [Vibrio parahaemolyticus]TOL03237.1 DNA-binding protein [Vibrio parahaemolyticus]
MNKIITSFARWLINGLDKTVSWLERKDYADATQSKFVDLAPTDKADKTGSYSEALRFATNNPKISNIALTGPYGSGKSSVIQSFLKTYRRPVLHISLATFITEVKTQIATVDRQAIERSILQQMLYGADANNLPLSRFKRIQSPGIWSIFKSLYIMLGMFALWYVFHQREDVISGNYFTPIAFENSVNLGLFVLAATFLWVVLHHFYVASFGLSLKGISLKDVEIKPACDNESSILNRHLDEIVYFFQQTSYDLVIIEDLDRFDNADIFVTLREINSLVNTNAGVKRHIRFLYALRDDMFVNTERTKFFEFIIPVIPIINTSNSIDMVLKQGERLALDEGLDHQFLREVSRYLNDLRLIQNIFNEYSIYSANLETDGENYLDANKLLAVLIYKNVYPRDFEQLHRGKGTISEILNLHDELISLGETKYRAEITSLENQLAIAECQTPTDLKELRQIYAMALIEMLPLNIISVGIAQNSQVPIGQLVSHGQFEQLIEAPHILCRNTGGGFQRVALSGLKLNADQHKTYLQRKEEIENKAEKGKTKILRTIRDLRLKIATLRTAKLNEQLRLNNDRLQKSFEKFGQNGELARFLLLEGYLDDTYYQYTSLFHSGRLSPNDNKFLIKIRAFITPEPDFPIDNPNEVIVEMRDEDFGQSYTLNISLVDRLLSDQSRYRSQLEKLFGFIMEDFSNCESFLSAYYVSGSNVPKFLQGLANVWNRLVPTILSSPNSLVHVTQLIGGVTERSLKSISKDFEELPVFVSENLSNILSSSPELSPKRFICLNFGVKDFEAIKDHSEIVNSMFEEGLFDLTLANIEFAYQAILGEEDITPLHTRNFTAIRATNSTVLINRIESDFDDYLRNILLSIQTNTEEETSAILDVVCREEIDLNTIQEFLEQQTQQLPTLECVPDRLHSMLFSLTMIVPNWENCLFFMASEGFEAQSLVEYLDRDVVRSAILKQALPHDRDSKSIRSFLLNANSLSDISYKEYVRALPKSFTHFPEGVEPTKLIILIQEAKIEFCTDSLNALNERALQVLFAANNIDTFLAVPEDFSLEDDFLEELLESDISQKNKIKVVELMDLHSLVDLPERSALVGSIIVNSDANLPKIDGDITRALIKYSSPIATQISLFNKYHTHLSNGEVRDVLASLPKPYSEITSGYHTPRLKETPENQKLASWLDSREIISSWKISDIFKEIKVNLYRS